MRPTILLLTVFIVTILSCKKEAATHNTIYKEWQWENSTGGFTGRDTVKPANDDILILILKKDHTYITEKNGQEIAQGSFNISTINNQQILQNDHFAQNGGLWWGDNELIMRLQDNKLHLTEYQISEPYTHNFK